MIAMRNDRTMSPLRGGRQRLQLAQTSRAIGHIAAAMDFQFGKGAEQWCEEGSHAGPLFPNPSPDSIDGLAMVT